MLTGNYVIFLVISLFNPHTHAAFRRKETEKMSMQFFILWLLFTYHPYHVSVADIYYHEDQKSIQISYRMFLDDLELALRDVSGNETLNILEDSLEVHQANKRYFQQNFILSVNGKPKQFDYLGGEFEDDGLWTYLEITGIKKIEKIELTNKLLLDVYDDQQNIVHFKISGDKRSFIMNNGNTEAVYKPRD